MCLHSDSEDSDQTGRMPWLIWVFAGRTCHFVGFVMWRLNMLSFQMSCRYVIKSLICCNLLLVGPNKDPHPIQVTPPLEALYINVHYLCVQLGWAGWNRPGQGVNSKVRLISIGRILYRCAVSTSQRDATWSSASRTRLSNMSVASDGPSLWSVRSEASIS